MNKINRIEKRPEILGIEMAAVPANQSISKGAEIAASVRRKPRQALATICRKRTLGRAPQAIGR